MSLRKRILVLGNTGLNYSDKSPNNRMISIFYDLSKNRKILIDYYKLREATLSAKHINYVNEIENNSILVAVLSIIRRKTKYNLIIGESFRGAIICYIIYLIRGTPFIWRQFGSNFNDEIVSLPFNPKTFFKLILFRNISNSIGCKEIICTEDGCSNKYLFKNRLGVSSEKFHLIKNQRTPQPIKPVLNQDKSNKFIVTFVGRIIPWKKIHLLLKSLSLAATKDSNFKNNYYLQIIGISGDTFYEKNLKKYIEDNQMSSQVEFLKSLTLKDLSYKFQESSISVSLTGYNPIIESLQNSTPVITYEYGEVEDIFKKCAAVKIVANDIKKSINLSSLQELRIVKELSDELINAYNDNNLEELGKNGKNYLEKNFPDLDEHVKLINDVIIKALA